MRGSPLIRFIVLAIALAATGAGLARITGARENPTAAGPLRVTENPVTTAADSTPFRLLLSAAAREVEIDTGRVIRPGVGGTVISGLLELDPKNPRVGMLVRWQDPAAGQEHRFAKLTLELPGQPTFTHVFDARGDIDEILELPMRAAP
ncbi:MAG: hypothetical protein WED15_07390 [Akkermansiaceae bacterium]